MFPVVKLTPAPEDPFPGHQQPTPPPPVVVDGKEEYEVKEILNARYFRQRLQYLVKWQGYDNKHNKWVSASDVHDLDALQIFYDRLTWFGWLEATDLGIYTLKILWMQVLHLLSFNGDRRVWSLNPEGGVM